MLEEESLNPSLKIIIVGNGKVGKTTLTIKFVKNIFTSEYKKTLGVDFLNAKRYIKSIDKEVDYYIWDTAGQDYYNAITRRYYKGADGALIVFAINDRESYENVTSWYDKVVNECGRIPIILVMSKIDLKNEVNVTDKEAMNLSKELKIPLMKVSSKDGTMVNEVFEKLAIQHFKNNSNSNGLENIENLQKGKLKVRNDDIKELPIINENLNNNKKNKGFKLNTETEEELTERKKKDKDKGCCK
jgi:small GTP-binding protein